MGESLSEGTIVRWLKRPGDRVGHDEPLFELSTDKVDTDVPAPAAGVLDGDPRRGRRDRRGRDARWRSSKPTRAGTDSGARGAPPRRQSPQLQRRRARGIGRPLQVDACAAARRRFAASAARSAPAPQTARPAAPRRRSHSAARRAESRRSCQSDRFHRRRARRRQRAGAVAGAVDRAARIGPRRAHHETRRPAVSGRGRRDAPCRRPLAGASALRGAAHKSGPTARVSLSPEAARTASSRCRTVRKRIARHMRWSVRISPHANAQSEADMSAVAALLERATRFVRRWARR